MVNTGHDSTDVFEQGNSVSLDARHFIDLDNQDQKTIATIARMMYSNKRYSDAEKAFNLLVLTDTGNKNYWLNLGKCRQHLKRYEQAILAFSVAADLDGKDADAPLHAAECYLLLRQFEPALDAIASAHALADNMPEPATIRQRAQSLFLAIETLLAKKTAT